MGIVVENVAVLVIFLLIGWALRKKNILGGENLKMLSILEVWVFLPCKSFQGFSANCNVTYLSEKFFALIVSTLILVVLVVVNRILVPIAVKDPYRQKVIRYSLTISNSGYFGYALVESVFGELALLDMMMFSLPLMIYTYTEGYRMLTNQETLSLQRIMNPVFVSILIGGVFGLMEWELPAILNSAVEKSAACMAPVSMLLAGIMISEYSIKRILLDKSAYILSALRLLGIPLVLCVLLCRVCPKEVALTAVLLHAMPCGLNTIVFPNMVGEDCELGASLALVSTLFSIVTIPICIRTVEWMCR